MLLEYGINPLACILQRDTKCIDIKTAKNNVIFSAFTQVNKINKPTLMRIDRCNPCKHCNLRVECCSATKESVEVGTIDTSYDQKKHTNVDPQHTNSNSGLSYSNLERTMLRKEKKMFGCTDAKNKAISSAKLHCNTKDKNNIIVDAQSVHEILQHSENEGAPTENSRLNGYKTSTKVNNLGTDSETSCKQKQIHETFTSPSSSNLKKTDYRNEYVGSSCEPKKRTNLCQSKKINESDNDANFVDLAIGDKHNSHTNDNNHAKSVISNGEIENLGRLKSEHQIDIKNRNGADYSSCVMSGKETSLKTIGKADAETIKNITGKNTQEEIESSEYSKSNDESKDIHAKNKYIGESNIENPIGIKEVIAGNKLDRCMVDLVGNETCAPEKQITKKIHIKRKIDDIFVQKTAHVKTPREIRALKRNRMNRMKDSELNFLDQDFKLAVNRSIMDHNDTSKIGKADKTLCESLDKCQEILTAKSQKDALRIERNGCETSSKSATALSSGSCL